MGSQWPGMAKQLMDIPEFDHSLRLSSQSVEELGINVYEMLQNIDPTQYQNNTLNCMLAVTSIQVV